MVDTSQTPVAFKTVRKPDSSESRLIARHEHRYYNNLVVGGIYNIPLEEAYGKIDSTNLFSHFQGGLCECVRVHPFLSVVIKKSTSNQHTYARCSQINLKSHFNFINTEDIRRPPDSANEDDLIRDIIHHLHNEPDLTFFDKERELPSWRIDVFPLGQTDQIRLFVSFTYCHTIGDGMSGIAFHKTLLRNMKSTQMGGSGTTDVVIPPNSPLPCLPKLPISVSYLMAPALGLYLPKLIRNLTGFKASVSGADETTWTGSDTFVENPDKPTNTALEILSLDATTFSKVLKACKRHDTKLTSVLNEVISICLSALDPVVNQVKESKVTNFVSSTPNNLRKLANISNDVIGIMASTVYTTHHFHNQNIWEEAQRGTQHLAASTSTFRDQPIGLLWFISDINGWMKGQIGHTRDASWQLSNLMSFDGVSSGDKVKIEKMYFCQPADAVGVPLNFNTVSVKGGDLVICISWQPGSTKFFATEEAELQERQFVRDSLIPRMKTYLEGIALS